jgi:protein-tyrosine phosphatase
MIDLHTHLLPGWDDGVETSEEAGRLAELARQDGIRKIVLTPHVFRAIGHENDLDALDMAMISFLARARDLPVEFFRGAELFIHHDLARILKERPLTINGSSYVFLEFPSDRLLPGAQELFFNLMIEGFIPIISHPERNKVFAEKPGFLCDFVQMGCLAQVTACSLTGGFGGNIRRVARRFLEHNLVQIIASDAHDGKRRPPILSAAVQVARKIVGDERAEAMVTSIPQAILDDKAIGDWGDPENPDGNRKRRRLFPNWPGKRLERAVKERS